MHHLVVPPDVGAALLAVAGRPLQAVALAGHAVVGVLVLRGGGREGWVGRKKNKNKTVVNRSQVWNRHSSCTSSTEMVTQTRTFLNCWHFFFLCVCVTDQVVQPLDDLEAPPGRARGRLHPGRLRVQQGGVGGQEERVPAVAAISPAKTGQGMGIVLVAAVVATIVAVAVAVIIVVVVAFLDRNNV